MGLHPLEDEFEGVDYQFAHEHADLEADFLVVDDLKLYVLEESVQEAEPVPCMALALLLLDSAVQFKQAAVHKCQPSRVIRLILKDSAEGQIVLANKYISTQSNSLSNLPLLLKQVDQRLLDNPAALLLMLADDSLCVLEGELVFLDGGQDALLAVLAEQPQEVQLHVPGDGVGLVLEQVLHVLDEEPGLPPQSLHECPLEPLRGSPEQPEVPAPLAPLYSQQIIRPPYHRTHQAVPRFAFQLV